MWLFLCASAAAGLLLPPSPCPGHRLFARVRDIFSALPCPGAACSFYFCCRVSDLLPTALDWDIAVCNPQRYVTLLTRSIPRRRSWQLRHPLHHAPLVVLPRKRLQKLHSPSFLLHWVSLGWPVRADVSLSQVVGQWPCCQRGCRRLSQTESRGLPAHLQATSTSISHRSITWTFYTL